MNHTFPPASFAGSELCVLNQAKELQRRGHEAAVFYRIADPSRDEYSIETSEYEGVTTFAINFTYRFVQTFQEIYVNSAVAVRFARILRQWRADVVHFHHLTNLSLSLVDEVKAFGAPAVMTLHDYWLLCQRGQLLKQDLQLCSGPSLENCRSCLAPQLLRGQFQQYVSFLLKHRIRRSGGHPNKIDLLDLRCTHIDSEDRRFVGLTCFDLGDRRGETLLAHPASSIRRPLRLEHPAVLEASIGMHPATYDQEGYGVHFQIERAGRLLFQKVLNPKKNPDHRGWHAVRLELAPSDGEDDCIVLRTLPEKEGDNRFCTAGWRKPVIHAPNLRKSSQSDFSERKKQIQSLLYAMAELVSDSAAAFSMQANEGIHHRMNWARRVMENVDMFISPSRFLCDFFIQHDLPEYKIQFLDNGFEPSRTAAPRMRHKPIRFGYIGTWIPSKGVNLALKAFQTVDPSDAKLIVHGFFPGYDGMEDYESYLQSLAGSSVEWGRKYDPSEVPDLLQEIDCLIMPSIWWENSPLTIHESFLAGVPVITADVGGMAEQVRDGGGMVFRHRDVNSLRSVVQNIIRKPEILDVLRHSIPGVQSLTGHVDYLIQLYANLLVRNKNE
ncbi:MAG: glycosyltransferase [Candidatus Omnitrophica bacterium]|nr:glycosyltransferase [Candidatus Omnitrophota bacterium]